MHHGEFGIVVAFAVTLIAWAVFSARLANWSITPAIIFVAAGIFVTGVPGGVAELDPGGESLRTLAEFALALVLFTDAARVNVRSLRRQAGPPIRLLFVGLPLTVALGFGIAVAVFGGLDPWLCALIAAAVAPTDAALGSPLMADERIPAAVRQTLNVESGLNDGLITPVVTFFLAGAVAELGGEHSATQAGALGDLAVGIGVGIAVGAAGGLLLAVSSRRGWTMPVAGAVSVLALALLAYAGALVLDANGFVAAFVGGLAFAAVRPAGSELLEFASEAGELLGTAVWFAFGAVALNALDRGPWEALLFAALALTVVRMLPVAIATIGVGLSPSTVAFIGWFGPRGLATVVFGLIAFSELPEGEGRDIVLAAVTATVLLSVIAHGLTARPFAGRYAASIHASPDRKEHSSVAHRAFRKTLGHHRPRAVDPNEPAA